MTPTQSRAKKKIQIGTRCARNDGRIWRNIVGSRQTHHVAAKLVALDSTFSPVPANAAFPVELARARSCGMHTNPPTFPIRPTRLSLNLLKEL